MCSLSKHKTYKFQKHVSHSEWARAGPIRAHTRENAQTLSKSNHSIKRNNFFPLENMCKCVITFIHTHEFAVKVKKTEDILYEKQERQDNQFSKDVSSWPGRFVRILTFVFFFKTHTFGVYTPRFNVNSTALGVTFDRSSQIKP